MNNCKRNILSYTLKELSAFITEQGQPAFRAKQIFEWLHKKRVCEFDEMTSLPAVLRQTLIQNFTIELPSVAQKLVSKDGTIKYLLRFEDGNCVEAVLMRYNHGNTLCVSSQVGCRMGCKFCASAQGGLLRSLSAGEILAQVYVAEHDENVRVSNVVLMGIGEPLDNFDSVMTFIELVTSPDGANISGRHISLSTCGLVPTIKALEQRKLGLTLSVSLHAANNETRSQMMPINDTYPLEMLIPACRAYQKNTGRRVSFEYAMVHGVNDTEQDANELAKLLLGMGAHINLIPINPVDGSPFGPSDRKNIAAFQRELTALGLNATVRRRLGTDIEAACGQLRQKKAHKGRHTVKITGKTDIGRSRAENQDNFRSGSFMNGTSWGIVCDGMGGAQHGRLASLVACEAIEAHLFEQLENEVDESEIEAILMQSLQLANAAVYARSEDGKEMMGTTAVAVVAHNDCLHIAHVGDSRAYIFLNGQLSQITRDHSMVQALIDQGAISPEAAKRHPEKNVITRALGVDATVEAEYSAQKLLQGATLLLCTDGLTNMVPAESIEKIMAGTDFYALPAELVQQALIAGGQDNVTVVLMQLQEDEASA